MTALALAVALSGMPELVSLYNENRLTSTHLLRQRGKEILHPMQLQVGRSSCTFHACQVPCTQNISAFPCICDLLTHSEKLLHSKGFEGIGLVRYY